MPPLCRAIASDLAFLWPDCHVNGLVRKEVGDADDRERCLSRQAAIDDARFAGLSIQDRRIHRQSNAAGWSRISNTRKTARSHY
jgi:hypothetical protein